MSFVRRASVREHSCRQEHVQRIPFSNLSMVRGLCEARRDVGQVAICQQSFSVRGKVLERQPCGHGRLDAISGSRQVMYTDRSCHESIQRWARSRGRLQSVAGICEAATDMRLTFAM